MMTSRELESAAHKLRTVFELFEAGVEMMHQTLRRKHPRLDDDEIQKLVTKWLRHRPGAEYGDAVGRPGKWPREARGS
jgi:hypothetical protein